MSENVAHPVVLGSKLFHHPENNQYYLWVSNYDKSSLIPLETEIAYNLSRLFGIPIKHSIPPNYGHSIQIDFLSFTKE